MNSQSKKPSNINLSDSSLVVSPVRRPRHGWDKAFALMHHHNDDQLLDADMITSEFDDDEWTWKNRLEV